MSTFNLSEKGLKKVQDVPQAQHHRKKINKAKQKLLFTELVQYVHHYSQYTNLAVLSSQETHV
jgi:hypothetical protein